MKATEALRAAMERREVRPAELARMTGETRYKTSNRLRQENISVKLLSYLAGKIGYKVVLVPMAKQVREGEYEVE